VEPFSVRPPRLDCESVDEDSRCAYKNVIRVVAVVVLSPYVSRKHAPASLRVPFCLRLFSAAESSVKLHVLRYDEGSRPVFTGCGAVHSLGHPDFLAASSGGEGVLQASEGGSPTASIAFLSPGTVYVDYLRASGPPGLGREVIGEAGPKALGCDVA